MNEIQGEKNQRLMKRRTETKILKMDKLIAQLKKKVEHQQFKGKHYMGHD